MITKKLLSKILGADVTFVDGIQNNTLGFSVCGVDFGRINIYELTHKAKKWASDNGYELLSSSDGTVGVWTFANSGSWDIPPDNEFYTKDDEFKSVSKACQWIMETEAL